jgi:hypothetical protein
MKFRQAVAVSFILPLGLFAQEFRGTLSGSITDPTGSSIAGGKVTVTETHTGTKIESVTDSTGQYTAPFLLPGDYDIAARVQGFREFIRKGVHLGAGDHTVIDIRLEVGEVTQTMEVTADAPQLNTENASAGQSITTKEVEDLPLNGGTPMALATLSLGVIGTGQPGLIHPFDSGGAAGFSVAGGYAQTSELQIDGSPDATWDGRLAFSVPKDAVQELRVKAFDSDAANGHSGGGTFNQVLKTGTNVVRGTLWEQNEPNTLTANDFFNNAKGVARPVSHLNQYGVTAGGPIYIPKVFDGRNKLFWFFAYEAMKDGQPNPTFTTVPTAAERTGDFSKLLAVDGSSTQLYDPYSGALSGTTISRTPYAGNKIPTSQLNPIALNYLQFYPQPNLAVPVRPDDYQNFGNSATTNDDYNNQLGRLDYNMSDKSRMYMNIRRTGYSQVKNNYFENASEGSVLFRNNWGGSVDEVYTINSSNMIDFRANFTRMAEAHASPSTGYDPTALGFPSYLASNALYMQMPVISFSSNSNFQALSSSGSNNLPSQSFQLFTTYVKIKGNHILKIGADLRQYRLNTFTVGSSTGTFSFSGNSWVRPASTSSSTVVIGQDFASFLLGLPYTSTYDLNTYGSWYSYYGSGFVQDDWRIKPNLTINLGVRFDHDGPYHEKWGRTADGFDTTSVNPLATAAMAAYAKSPIAQIPASAFNVLGGLTFASPGNNAVYQNNSHIVSPRVGFAWTPELLKGKTVFRGAFGVFVAPVTIANLAITGTYSTNPELNQEGFSQTTTVTVPSGAVTPLAAGVSTLSNPFPAGFTRPAGSSAGLATFAGQNISFLNPNMLSPYSMRWDFDVQHSLTPNTMLEVLYIGNHSLHLPVAATQLNGIPQKDLSTLGVRDPAQTALTTSIANPFAGLATSQNSSSSTPVQLLARYPEFPVGDSSTGWNGSGGVIEQNLNAGSSYFHSLNVRLQKRVSGGLYLTTNYIRSRLIEFDSWLNSSDPRPEKRVSPTDRPNRFVAAVTYALPVGQGQLLHFQSRLANTLIGDWVLTTMYQYQTGGPLTFLNASSTSPGDYVYFGAPLNLNSRQVNGTAFDTTAFDTKAADAFNYHLRTFPTTFNNLRADGINQLDASVLKRFALGENRRFELRFEAYNLPNHPVFAAPNTQASASGFGTITATANRFRTIQAIARIYF